MTGRRQLRKAIPRYLLLSTTSTEYHTRIIDNKGMDSDGNAMIGKYQEWQTSSTRFVNFVQKTKNRLHQQDRAIPWIGSR